MFSNPQNRPSVITCAPASNRNCNLSHCHMNGCSPGPPADQEKTNGNPGSVLNDRINVSSSILTLTRCPVCSLPPNHRSEHSERPRDRRTFPPQPGEKLQRGGARVQLGVHHRFGGRPLCKGAGGRLAPAQGPGRGSPILRARLVKPRGGNVPNAPSTSADESGVYSLSFLVKQQLPLAKEQ